MYFFSRRRDSFLTKDPGGGGPDQARLKSSGKNQTKIILDVVVEKLLSKSFE